MLNSTALLLDSNIRNSVCTPAKLPCRRVEMGYDSNLCIYVIRRLWHEGMFKARGTRALKFPRAIIDNYACGTYNVLFYFIISKRFKQIFKYIYKILLKNQIASLKNYFLNRARDNTFFNALVSADKGYTPLNLSDNIISDIVKPNIPDTIANIK
jgi:hypothetical protein